MNRLFRLIGEPFDLEDLMDMFSTEPWHVVRYDSIAYLSMDIDDGLDDQQAIAIAEDSLSIMNGLGLLHDENFKPVSISGIGRRDPETGEVRINAYMKATSNIRVRARGKASMTVRRADGTIEESEPPATEPFGASVLKAAAKTPSLQRALFLYGKLGHNWRELYLVLEAIEDGNDGEKSLLQKPWADGRLKDLKKTANSFKAIGHEARHGSTNVGINSPSITLTEARDVLKTALNGWVAELLNKS